MAERPETSSSISFASSSYLSNASSSQAGGPAAAAATNIEALSLNRLSSNLERLLLDPAFDCSDAEILVDGASVGVHRCILAARSRFFRDLFAKAAVGAGEKPKYSISELVPAGRIRQEALMVFLGYMYTGKLKPAPVEASTCVDPTCAHDACWPAINFVVELMYASSRFQISELVSLFQRRLHNFVDRAHVEDVVPILLVAFHSKLNALVSHCVQRVARSDLDDTSLEKELPNDVVDEIRLIRKKSQPNEQASMDLVHEKRIRRIHKALDSDDVELVKMLLTESDITLDDAYALHYAVAYCDSKVVAEILELGLANVNLKNDRGYTPLHMAAMRREPAVLVSLLRKGVNVLETTTDGQSAVRICRRLTRAKDYYTKTEQGQESNKDRLCIDILDREMRRNPLVGEESVMSPLFADDLHMKLLYLENRVALARLLFPMEAKVAMEIAHAETSSEFAGLSVQNLREVDLNETPSMQNQRLRMRVDALSKTVELGRRFFPICSQMLDKLMDDDLSDLLYLEKGTADEQQVKRRRFCELKEDVQKAFCKDKARTGRSGLSSSSSSSSSLKADAKQHKVVRK